MGEARKRLSMRSLIRLGRTTDASLLFLALSRPLWLATYAGTGDSSTVARSGSETERVDGSWVHEPRIGARFAACNREG
jgi:hypothetical protein